jgi:hypothetical protein
VREFLRKKLSVIPLVPEFITPQDGSEKQDYELAATKIVLSSTWNSLIFPLCCKPLNISL